MDASAAWEAAVRASEMFPDEDVFTQISRLIQRDEIKEALRLIAKAKRSKGEQVRLLQLDHIKSLLQA